MYRSALSNNSTFSVPLFKVISAIYFIAAMTFVCQKYTTYCRMKNITNCHSIVIFYIFDYFKKTDELIQKYIFNVSFYHIIRVLRKNFYTNDFAIVKSSM